MAGTDFDLQGRVALVTGAGKGLGRAIAGALARAGADVAIASRTRRDLDAVAADIEPCGRRVLAVPTDVSDEDSVRRLTAAVLAEFGSIDILVNNAGIKGEGPVIEMSQKDWDHVMAVNLRGPMLCCKHVGPHLLEQRRGKVINVASVLASSVSRYMSSYAASKAALVQFTRTLALEWIHYNVQVNALCPGYFLTPINEDFFATEAGDRLVSKLPLKRIAQPREIEGAAIFLASDATSYITGTTLYVDGGHSLLSG